MDQHQMNWKKGKTFRDGEDHTNSRMLFETDITQRLLDNLQIRQLADCQLADWISRGLDNSRTSQLTDWTSRGLDNSRSRQNNLQIRQLADWTSRGLDNSRTSQLTD